MPFTPPTERKALKVRQLKNFFASGNSDSDTDASSRPESARKTTKNEEIFTRLMALKQRLDDDDEIKVSERTLKVLQERQSRRASRESVRSSSAKSDTQNSSPETGNTSTTLHTQIKRASPPPTPTKTEVKKISTLSPQKPVGPFLSPAAPKKPVDPVPTGHKRSTSEPMKQPAIVKETKKLETKAAGGRIFLTAKPKLDKNKPVKPLEKFNKPVEQEKPSHESSHKATKVLVSSQKTTDEPKIPDTPKLQPKLHSKLVKPVEPVKPTSTAEKPERPTSGTETKKSSLTFSFGSKKKSSHEESKETFQPREKSEKNSHPSFLHRLRNYEMKRDENLEIELVVNGLPKPTLKWFKDNEEMKLNEYRQKWIGNKVLTILFPEYWQKEALLTVTATNPSGTASNECIIYVEKSYEVIHELHDQIHELQDLESEAEIDSSDLSEMVAQLRMEQVPEFDPENDQESQFSEDFLPRELSPIFEVTEDEISHSLRSNASSRRSSIKSIESIRSTLTMLTPTQSYLVTRTPTIEKLFPQPSLSISSDDISPPGGRPADGDKTPVPDESSIRLRHDDEDPISKAENNYRAAAKYRTAEVSVVPEVVPGPGQVAGILGTAPVRNPDSRRESFQSIGTVDDDAFSVDSYATNLTDDGFDNLDATYRSTKDLMSFVKQNFVSKTTCYTTDTCTTDDGGETEVTTPNTLGGFETVASPNDPDLFPTPTSTQFPTVASSPTSVITVEDNDQVKILKNEELLVKKLEIRKQYAQTRRRRVDEPSTETESELETAHQITQSRTRKKLMSEEDRIKKERQKSFQQKYRLTQRFIEDSIKGNAASLDINAKELEKLNRYSPAEFTSRIYPDSEVFLDTDDDGMDTVSEMTIDFGRTTRQEFENQTQELINDINFVCEENFIDL